MKKNLSARQSSIHGKGLFTTIFIKKGDLLGFCEVKKSKVPGHHTLCLGKKSVDVKCKFKYINHSCKPNVVYYDDLSVVALKNIKAGEELTHYYGKEWEEHA